MNAPAPVDLSKLKGILGNAMKVMNKVEKKDFSTGHVDGRALNEDGIAQLQNEGITKPQQLGDYTDEQVHKSGLPPEVKKAMLMNRIPKATPNHTFTLENVSDLIEKPMGIPKTPKTNINENVNSDLITISKTELKNIINEQIIEVLTKSYNKTITEDAIKKTITTLIKEGKLTVKKKTL